MAKNLKIAGSKKEGSAKGKMCFDLKKCFLSFFELICTLYLDFRKKSSLKEKRVLDEIVTKVVSS